MSLTAPGENRVVKFKVGAGVFACRRPSRADTHAINDRFVSKLIGFFGLQAESELRNSYDGRRRLAEARCEVCLRPAVRPYGRIVDLGETAPAHWLDDAPQGPQPQGISFANVSDEELDAVGDWLEENVFKKKETGTPSSGAFVVEPING